MHEPVSEPEPAESEAAPEPEDAEPGDAEPGDAEPKDAEPKDAEPEWRRKARLARVFEGRHAENGNDERLRS